MTNSANPKSILMNKKTKKKTKQHQLLTAGLPFVFFSVLAAWVVSNALQGKLKERETAHGVTSQSLRQASLQVEHDETMEKMNKIVASQDFDNTKRIKRPEEILQERKRERERRNAWYRRLYRWVLRKEQDDS